MTEPGEMASIFKIVDRPVVLLKYNLPNPLVVVYLHHGFERKGMHTEAGRHPWIVLLLNHFIWYPRAFDWK